MSFAETDRRREDASAERVLITVSGLPSVLAGRINRDLADSRNNNKDDGVGEIEKLFESSGTLLSEESQLTYHVRLTLCSFSSLRYVIKINRP